MGYGRAKLSPPDGFSPGLTFPIATFSTLQHRRPTFCSKVEEVVRPL